MDGRCLMPRAGNRQRIGVDHVEGDGGIEFSWKTLDGAAEEKAPDGHPADSKRGTTNRSHEVNDLNQDGGRRRSRIRGRVSLAFGNDDALRERLMIQATFARPSLIEAAEYAPTADNRHEDVIWWQECLECFLLVKNVKNLLARPRSGNKFRALVACGRFRCFGVCWGKLLRS